MTNAYYMTHNPAGYTDPEASALTGIYPYPKVGKESLSELDILALAAGQWLPLMSSTTCIR